MKKYLAYSTVIIVCLMLFGTAKAQTSNRGLPFFKNFSADDYHAHHRNYKMVCDEYGTVFVANFEGIVYFDGASWRKIHTPGINRVTDIFYGSDGKIWVSGYKTFGFLAADKNGNVIFKTANGKAKARPKGAMSLNIDNTELSVPPSGGIVIKQSNGTCSITEADGLCSNDIVDIAYNGKYTVWGATNNGIFAMDYPSPYYYYSKSQGINGEVYSIGKIGETLYAGTHNGLFIIRNGNVIPSKSIDLACWMLSPYGKDKLLAASSAGVFIVSSDGERKITDANTLSAIELDNGQIVAGEMDGVTLISPDGKRTPLADIENVVWLKPKGKNVLAESIYREMWSIDPAAPGKETCISEKEDLDEPLVLVTDELNRTWRTDFEGKNLSLDGNSRATKWIKPLGIRKVNALYCGKDNILWVGGSYGLISWDANFLNRNIKRAESHESRLYIREVVNMTDSVLWGGYTEGSMAPKSTIEDISIPSDARTITVYFSTDYTSVFAPVQYRFRTNGGQWSAWSEATSTTFRDMPYGNWNMEVQARDVFGNVTDSAKVSIYVRWPWYLDWYAQLFYLLLLIAGIWGMLKYRTKRLEEDKQKLEKTIAERTSELSDALSNLKQTQGELVRMERSATAGKLTKGLIDRILNPINYINNFSKLTNGLASDLHEDIEDEKENMTPDNYDDCVDILEMMHQNLTKIEEHGVNTTRTLRAMEALLREQVREMREIDVVSLCRQALEVTQDYYRKAIDNYGIKVELNAAEMNVTTKADPEAMKKAFLTIASNAMYAMTKKYEHEPFDAILRVTVGRNDDGRIELRFRDNGIGIEEAIQQKVFDPFFTTKPTSEAAGVGLYLARDIIQIHGGSISFTSEKNVYTEFIITL